MKKSILDGIKGIGPKKRDLLLENFSSIDEIKQADLKLLSDLVGSSVAKIVKEYLSRGSTFTVMSILIILRLLNSIIVI